MGELILNYIEPVGSAGAPNLPCNCKIWLLEKLEDNLAVKGVIFCDNGSKNFEQLNLSWTKVNTDTMQSLKNGLENSYSFILFILIINVKFLFFEDYPDLLFFLLHTLSCFSP